MIPVAAIMAAMQTAQQMAQNQNKERQQIANNMQNPIQMGQFEIPSINSVFGR